MVKLLLLMLFMHIVDDYYLQGILASMKQKSWWRKQEGYKNLYKNDYKIALLMHSMSWSIMLLLPSIILLNPSSYVLFSLFLFNLIVHYIVDNEKANKLRINLMVDQTIHLSQVFLTWVILCQLW